VGLAPCFSRSLSENNGFKTRLNELLPVRDLAGRV
jgi:hypothetical protein